MRLDPRPLSSDRPGRELPGFAFTSGASQQYQHQLDGEPVRVNPETGTFRESDRPGGDRPAGRPEDFRVGVEDGAEPRDGGAGKGWVSARSYLSRSLPESTFRMWIEPVEPVAIRGGTFFLTAPEAVSAWVQRRYEGLIVKAFATSGIRISGISFESLEPDRAGSGERVRGREVGVNPLHTFDRFVIGAGNHLAHSAALAVAESPAEAYNPLFLHGDPGLGKTHLLGAIANYLAENMPSLRVLFTSAESFTNEFVHSLRSDGAEAFKERHRNLDVLIVDDVQYLAGKPHTEEEFFHTFNILHESGSQIVLSADRLPRELGGLAERLSNRFEWGLEVELAEPDLSTRLAVLRQLIMESGLEMADPEAVTMIASRVGSNLRQLRGTLTRVVAEASLSGGSLTRDLVSKVVPGLERPRGDVNPAMVGERVAEHFGLGMPDLVSRKRDKKTSEARAYAMFLTRELCDLPLSEIGARYGGRDHSTVMSVIGRIEEAYGNDPEKTRTLEELRASVQVGVSVD
jgi:chromosomal replication initiator protein